MPREALKNSHKTKAQICADARAKNAAQKRTCISILGAFWASFAPRRRAKMRGYAKNVVFQHIPKQIKRLSSGRVVAYDDVTKEWLEFVPKKFSLKSLSEKEIIEAVGLIYDKDAVTIQESCGEHHGEN